MRILHVPHAYSPVLGGSELLIQRVGEALACKGHSVRVVTTDVADVAGLFEFDAPRIGSGCEEINGVDVLRVPFGERAYRSGGRVVKAVPWTRPRVHLSGRLMDRIRTRFAEAVEREVRRFQPDVVVALPHVLPNVECVLQVHGHLPFPLVLIPLLHSDWPDDVVRRMGQALEQADSVVAVTKREASELETRYGVPPGSIVTAGIGVDVPPEPLGGTRQPRVLYLGRKVASKRIEDLLAAMAFVWTRRPDVELVLAGARGAGSQSVDQSVAGLPASFRSQVRQLDDVSEVLKSELLRSSSCLVLPSHTESFGIVLVEAMAHATPVVAPDLPVFRDVVIHGEDGLLVDPADPGAMALAILQLLGKPRVAASMGSSGREKVLRDHAWQLIAHRYLAAYQHACQARSAAAPKQPARRAASE